jgi:glycine/D-amino acid oxidase-like deaminating enzyme
MRIGNLPADDARNGWSAILPPRAGRPALQGDVKADWVVVGAGYAGLAAARRLAENRPDDQVALIEAQAAGENASGRNSGFAIDVPHNVGSSLDELDGSHRYIRLSRAAIDHLDGLVTARRIDCDWSRRGKYHAAASAKGAREVLEPMSRELAAHGEPFRWLDKAALAAEIGTAYFHPEIYTPGGALMNPAALTRGLADSLPANVTLYERTPVTAMHNANGIHLATPSGSVRAPRMILAVNGWAPEFGAWRGRLLRVKRSGDRNDTAQNESNPSHIPPCLRPKERLP